MSEPIKTTSPADRPDHDTDPLPVGHKHPAFASSAFKGVVSNWLKDRLDLLAIAGCAYAVKRLPVCMRGLQFIHERPLFGPLRAVAYRLGLKLVRLSLLLLNCSNNALHRYLLRLHLDQVVEKLGDQSFRGDLVKLGLVEESLHVRGDVSCVLGCRDGDANQRSERDQGFYQDRFLLVSAEGNEGPGERCERSSVPPSYQLETTPHSLRAPAATDDAREPTSPRRLPSVRAGWQRLKAAHDRLNDSMLGDFLATLCFCLTAIIAAICFLA